MGQPPEVARLTHEEEAELGLCVKNNHGAAAMFATSSMGAPDTLTSIYLGPADLIEYKGKVKCTTVNASTAEFSSPSGIRIGVTAVRISRITHAKMPRNGQFCSAYEITSTKGPLRAAKGNLEGFTDLTGVQGSFKNGKLEWAKLFGITSN